MPTKTRPFRSGHCNPSNPDEIHAQCRGSYNGNPCICAHHQTPAPPDASSSQEIPGGAGQNSGAEEGAPETGRSVERPRASAPEFDWTIPKRPGWELLEAPHEKVRHQVRNLTHMAKTTLTYASSNRDHVPVEVMAALSSAVDWLNEACGLMEEP